MQSILGLEIPVETGRSSWPETRNGAQPARGGADSDFTETPSTNAAPTMNPESQEGNPKMAQETLRAQAAAASAGGGSRTSDAPRTASSAPKQAAEPQRNDYELVLGRGQIASCLFAGTVVVAIFTGGAYFAGKLTTVNCVAASNSVPPAAAPLQVASVVPPSTEVSSTSAPNLPPAIPYMETAPAGTAEIKNSVGGAPNTPLFANPKPGALYLQVGAVDRGMATIIAEGLRQHGLTSFVAPGPGEKFFRVLVGPFANQNDYKRAKAEVDSIDIGNFAQQFGK